LYLKEHNGRWKMFAYYAKRAFSPILPSSYKAANGDIIIELISDSMQDYQGSLNVKVFKLDSMTPLIERQVPVQAVIHKK